MSKCIICGEKEATVPDRNTLSSRKKVCKDCHAARLRGDLVHILAVERRRKEPR